MRIDIKKAEMKDKRNFCKKCKTFIFETKKDGYINFPNNVISSDGMSITLKCKKCGEQINKIEFTNRTHRGVRTCSDAGFNSFYFL